MQLWKICKQETRYRVVCIGFRELRNAAEMFSLKNTIKDEE